MLEILVSESAVKEEFYKSTEKAHIVACWVGIILNLFWFISDYFVLPESWFSFLIFRFCVSSISLIAIFFRKRLNISIYTCMFVLVLGISVQNAFMWSVMDAAHLQQHAFAYIALFIGAGMLVLWEMRLSLILMVITLISNAFFYKLNSPLTVDQFLTNGGMLTLTVSIFCVFMIRTRFRLTYKEIRSRLELAMSKQMIEKEHKLVLHQKLEIMDSINYASSIQSALIPKENYFTKYFKDCFVLFKPKDIVSGDFYWIYESKEFIFYATGDCTGHGVPGGFMTMLGLSFLDEIVEMKSIKDPAEILNQMRDKIVSTLKQNGNYGESKDGMDITVCRIDKFKKQCAYASANNPLYIVRTNKTDNKKELHIYKADKQPCGFYHDQKPFNSQNIDLIEGDCIYTFTDGFPDQFGGPLGKKYMHKQFKEFLVKIAHLNFNDQKTQLAQSLDIWKGNLDQVDDVLVIGIKI